MPIYPPVPNVLASIQRFVVLMLENRSFDHLLGFEKAYNPDLDGVDGSESNFEVPGDPNSPSASVVRATGYGMPFDPGHEFADVTIQLYAPGEPPAGPITMGGFVQSALKTAPSFADAIRVMDGFQSDQLPAFTALARQFAVFNYWHSSLPGPTWPNRFFVHAATSGGLTDSPGTAQILAGFEFPNGTLYQRLAAAGRSWRIYHDGLPQAAGIDSLRSDYIDPVKTTFRAMTSFAADVQAGALPDYTFIEPNYDTGGNYLSGNSMHPLNDVRRGEALIKTVYETIRNSPLWASTLLIVTFDEHGGFYDHVATPPAVATGDDLRHKNPNEDFDFTRLGVRVPALAVSAYTLAGTVIGAPGAAGSSIYDHTSVLRTVEARFGLAALTQRDRAAQTLEAVLNTAAPRSDAPTQLPGPVGDLAAAAIATAPMVAPAAGNARLSDNQQSLVDLALRCNLDLAGPSQYAALAAEHAAVRTQADAASYLARHNALISRLRPEPRPRP